MEWVIGTAMVLTILYFVGMVIENHYWQKSRKHLRQPTEQELLDCFRQLNNGQEPDPFERGLIADVAKKMRADTESK
jgi:hypothetical protein